MRAHITRRREARPQVCLHVLDGDERRALRRHFCAARVEHMRMRVDQARQERRLTEVDDLRSHRNPDARLRSDLSDSLALKNHDLFRQHLAGLAVEQTAGTHHDRSRSLRALVDTAVFPYARGWACPAPGSGRSRGTLAQKRNRGDEYSQCHRHRGFASHRPAPFRHYDPSLDARFLASRPATGRPQRVRSKSS